MKAVRVLIALALAAALFAAGVVFERSQRHEHASEGKGAAKGYHCPMHPNVRSDKPGECPICHMQLVPDEDRSGDMTGTAERKVMFYQDPQNKQYRSDKPGINPETGNDLVPVYADDPASMPSGTIRVSPERQQLVGVQYGVATMQSAAQPIRAVGRVTADETRVAKVQTRIEGWIDRVFVDFTGKQVQQGQPLLTLYSPEMLATQQEYLLALRSREILRNSEVSSLRQDSNGLVEAARRRMELWGLSDQQIAQVEASGKPLTNITIQSPVSGYVTQKNAFAKQRVTPETELYTIVDLSRVWVMADVFENEAGAVRMGQRASITATAYPGRRFSATVTYIQPQVDAQSRTLRIRMELENPGLLFKPDMYVDVDLSTATAPRLTVPVDAVINSGLRQTVFVDRGNGFLEPRAVQVGQQSAGQIEILSGLRAGERIVTSGTFLIDSETQLRSAGGSSTNPSTPATTGPAEVKLKVPHVKIDPHAAHGHD